MREIKFRAFDRISKKMHYPKSLQYFQFFADGSWDLCESITQSDEDEVITGDTSDGELNEFYIGVLMQYTGLKDKNGVEIYEGDICKVYIKTGGVSDTVKGHMFGTVEYRKNRFLIIPSKYENTLSSYFGIGKIFGMQPEEFNHLQNIEVIGNIYQNPELLKL